MKNRKYREKKHGNYQNISKIRKTAISETRKNGNFGKNRRTQGLIGEIRERGREGEESEKERERKERERQRYKEKEKERWRRKGRERKGEGGK